MNSTPYKVQRIFLLDFYINEDFPFFAYFYVKLQEAYAAEKNEVGGWSAIGYTAPGEKKDSLNFTSSNFNYVGGGAAWSASNIAKLNDCPAVTSPSISKNNWKIEAEMKDAAQGDGAVVVTRTVTSGCEGLTPSFSSIGTSKSTSTGG